MKKKNENYYTQYHNFGKLQYYPGQPPNEAGYELSLMKSPHYVSTKKDTVLNLKTNDKILLIIGIRIERKMSYFAWSHMSFEGYEYLDDEDLPYNIYGKQRFFRVPIRLNELDGFGAFLHRQGNFGLGFQNVTNDPWMRTIRHIIKSSPCVEDSRLNWSDWIIEFERTFGIKSELYRFTLEAQNK